MVQSLSCSGHGAVLRDGFVMELVRARYVLAYASPYVDKQEPRMGCADAGLTNQRSADDVVNRMTGKCQSW